MGSTLNSEDGDGI